MRIAAFLVVASAIACSAQAQTAPAETQFLPIPDAPPSYLFSPLPLSGTMLKALIEPVPNTPPEVTPEPGSAAVAVARTSPDDTAPAAPAPAPVPDAAPADQATKPAEEAPAAPKKGVVTVIVENVESDSGTVNVAVCDKALSREGCPYHHEIKAARGFVETEFDDIPPGTYAVVSYHDVNGNREFDKFFGMPREPYALSGAAGDMLVPKFSDAALAIGPGPNSVVIRLKRLGG